MMFVITLLSLILNDANDTNVLVTRNSIDSILDAIKEEIEKIEVNESNDNRFAKITLFILLLICALLIKSQICQVPICYKRKKKPSDTIHIEELNYTIV